jgi:galactose mutarotase-like enzyme
MTCGCCRIYASITITSAQSISSIEWIISLARATQAPRLHFSISEAFHMSALICLSNDRATASISPTGAQLVGLSIDGHEFIWTPDARVWTETCPIMFPVIGRVRDDLIRVDGRIYPMPMHGFAAQLPFEILGATANSVTFRLTDDDDTRRHYPYSFGLTLQYTLDLQGLSMEARIDNPGERDLPFSFGLHPGLRWPLAEGTPKSLHEIVFPDDDGLVFTRPQDRLIGPARGIIPLASGVLKLDEEMFREGGLLLLALKSRSLTYRAPGALAVEISFAAFTHVLLWMRPGSPFLCIEPCLGHADPVDFTGDFAMKPGSAKVASASAIELAVRIALAGD